MNTVIPENIKEIMPLETELKFTLPDGALFESIRSLDEIAGYCAVDRGTKTHTDTYFDTTDGKLFHGRSVLRLRNKENRSVLTFKSHRESSGSFYQRNETEVETAASAEDICSGNLPDIPPVKAFREQFGNVPLTISLEAENNRSLIILKHVDADAFEIALDDVTFRGPRRSARVYELEVEKLSGSESELVAIGAWLTERFDLLSAGPSKYVLGMELVGLIES